MVPFQRINGSFRAKDIRFLKQTQYIGRAEVEIFVEVLKQNSGYDPSKSHFLMLISWSTQIEMALSVDRYRSGLIEKDRSERSKRFESTAAVKLQKVYRSYRTRRRLADSAVVAEELWYVPLMFLYR